MSDKPKKYLILWGDAPYTEYSESFSEKELAIQRIKELKEHKVKNKSPENWAELYQYVGGFQ